MGLLNPQAEQQQPEQQQPDVSEQIARQATQILHESKDAVLQKIMADGVVDEDECAEVAANMVSGTKPEGASNDDIAAALLKMCFTVAEMGEQAGGVQQGVAELAKASFAKSLMYYKRVHMGGE